jgi:hypothetical protein
MLGFDSIDKYTMKARVFPAAIALSPALALAVAYVAWDSFSISDAFVALASVTFLAVLADVARRGGKRIEKRLIDSWGGMPSTHLLRYRDATLDAYSKKRYLKFLASKIGEEVPTPEDEVVDLDSCDRFYSRCCLWLRENTRDREAFGILFEENMNYGFQRNLLGLKRTAVAVSAVVLIICIVALLFGLPVVSREEISAGLLMVGVFSIIQCTYFMAFVTEKTVYDAALLYARQLILCCERLIGEDRHSSRADGLVAN